MVVFGDVRTAIPTAGGPNSHIEKPRERPHLPCTFGYLQTFTRTRETLFRHRHRLERNIFPFGANEQSDEKAWIVRKIAPSWRRRPDLVHTIQLIFPEPICTQRDTPRARRHSFHLTNGLNKEKANHQINQLRGHPHYRSHRSIISRLLSICPAMCSCPQPAICFF